MWRFAVTLSGRGDSQRSGFQSSASSPHVPLWWFAPRMLTKISVPAGTWISCISCPSTPRIGIKRGTTVSLLALENNQLNNLCTETYMGLTGGTQSALVESCMIRSTPLSHEASFKWDSHAKRFSYYGVQIRKRRDSIIIKFFAVGPKRIDDLFA